MIIESFMSWARTNKLNQLTCPSADLRLQQLLGAWPPDRTQVDVDHLALGIFSMAFSQFWITSSSG